VLSFVIDVVVSSFIFVSLVCFCCTLLGALQAGSLGLMSQHTTPEEMFGGQAPIVAQGIYVDDGGGGGGYCCSVEL
jgi:hypothetical protein